MKINFGRKSYNYQLTTVNTETQKQWYVDIHCMTAEVVFAQTTMEEMPLYSQMLGKRGIQFFGQCAVVEIIKEYKQLNEMKFTVELDTNTLNPDHKRKDLRSTNLIKQKCCGNIKGTICTDGRPQRKYIMKEDVMSWTIYQ